jgi:hypothetical protein
MTKGDWIRHAITGEIECLDRDIIGFMNLHDEEGIPLTCDIIEYQIKNLVLHYVDGSYKILTKDTQVVLTPREGSAPEWACELYTVKNIANPKMPVCYDVKFVHQLQDVWRMGGEELRIALSTLNH